MGSNGKTNGCWCGSQTKSKRPPPLGSGVTQHCERFRTCELASPQRTRRLLVGRCLRGLLGPCAPSGLVRLASGFHQSRRPHWPGVGQSATGAVAANKTFNVQNGHRASSFGSQVFAKVDQHQVGMNHRREKIPALRHGKKSYGFVKFCVKSGHHQQS